MINIKTSSQHKPLQNYEGSKFFEITVIATTGVNSR